MVKNSRVTVRDDQGRRGVVAIEEIAKGEVILIPQGCLKDTASRYSLQIDLDKHLHPYSEHGKEEESYFRYLNHSCSPNGYFGFENFALIALTTIRPGVEITFNYNATEFDMVYPFRCSCGLPGCYEEIKGFKHLSVDERVRMLPQLAPFLRALIGEVLKV
jgi:SET domain-containing protein